MKIQCDVCEGREATVFCAADEAALCESCDRRVHHANKLASKHQRFSLLHPSSKETPPQCDICQERRAVLFCKEDRAILCRECDVPIHRASEHTKKHSRFLLTGVKLSASSAAYPTSPSSSNGQSETRASAGSGGRFTERGISGDHTNYVTPTFGGATTPTAYCQNSEDGSITTGDYYVMDATVGGWTLEDLLDASSAGSQLYCKTFDCEAPTSERWHHSEIIQNRDTGISFPSHHDLKMWTAQGPGQLPPDFPIFLPTI